MNADGVDLNGCVLKKYLEIYYEIIEERAFTPEGYARLYRISNHKED
jgi:hypothetical protein